MSDAWVHLSDAALLNTRINALGVSFLGTYLEAVIVKVYEELDHHGLRFYPECYLADEWFSPNDEPVIGIPFYLAHPRLIALEEKMTGEAEGSDPDYALRLLRHEVGHALSHAYRLQPLPAWRRRFGDPRLPYAPERVRPRPYSRHYVLNLKEGYAQTHPDEDWAETFAVWLDPESHWTMRYQGWPALKKLQYVDELVAHLKKRRPPRRQGIKTFEISTLGIRLGAYYAKRLKGP